MDTYSAFKHIAFKLNAEQVHDLTLNLLSLAPQISEVFSPLKLDPRMTIKDGELEWNFPVGLAAGFDKNAQCINFFERAGFGAIEVGTITKLKQTGNPKPRVFRLIKEESVRNAMGFPNAGSDKILQNIQKKYPYNICIGSNLGKNKDTTEEKTPAEYAYLYEKFAPISDYLVINISSPNTPGLRSFQKKDLLLPILEAVNEKRKVLPRPIYIKIAPDLSDDDLKMICELSKEMNFSGIIATNTTVQHDYGSGGVSGKYIKDISKGIRNKACQFLREDPDQTIIGVGGIDSYGDIKEFWKLGGGLTQIYTSYIFHGPQILTTIQNDIISDMEKYQFSNLQEMFENITKVD